MAYQRQRVFNVVLVVEEIYKDLLLMIKRGCGDKYLEAVKIIAHCKGGIAVVLKKIFTLCTSRRHCPFSERVILKMKIHGQKLE